MADDSYTPEPRVEALMREFAESGSSLLRVSRSELIPALMQERPSFGVATAGLSVLEREIAVVHRNEVASLLRTIALRELLDDARTERVMNRYCDPGLRESDLDVGHLRREARISMKSCAALPGFEPTARLLSSWVGDGRGTRPTVAELAAASCKLVPTMQARILCAFDLVQSSATRSALHILRRLSAMPLSDDHARRVAEGHALAYNRMGDPTRAHAAIVHGTRDLDDDPFTLLNRNVLAMQSGNREDALESGRQLDAMVDEFDRMLQWFVESSQARRRSGEWQPTEAAVRLRVQVESELGPVSRKVSCVFQ